MTDRFAEIDGRYTHGYAKRGRRHPDYGIWQAMLNRCRNSKQPQYKDYGARGIRVCDRWANSFTAFIEDMGPRPPGASIDRLDNELGYFPENCRWSDRKTQARNKRSSTRICIRGVVKTFAEWKELGVIPISYEAYRLRLMAGRDQDAAAVDPPMPRVKHKEPTK